MAFKGDWIGSWGSGPLEFKIGSEDTGLVSIKGHSDGKVSIRLEKGLVIADIARNDGMKQAFVGIVKTPNRIEGQYVHWNVSSFSPAFLEKITD